MHIRLSSLLLGFLILSCLLPSLPLGYSASARQGDLLNVNVYLKYASSDVAGYKTFSLSAPTGATNRTIYVSASTVGSYYVGKWLSPAIPRALDLDLPEKYNFYFEMYGNKSSSTLNNASFFCEIGYYRSGVEYPFFNSTRSDRLINASLTGMGWQSRLATNYTVLRNDRIYLKVFLYAEGSGNFYFGYDGRYVRSYVVDPTETRFFRNDWVSNATVPTAYTLTTGTLTSGAISNVATSDNTYMVFRGAYGTTKIVNVTFSGVVGQNFHLPLIQPIFEIKTNISVIANISFYNYTANNWDYGTGMNWIGSTPTTDTNKYCYSLYDSNKYTSTTGRAWKVKFYLTSANNFTFSPDYIAFKSVFYTLTTTITAVAAAADEDLYGVYSGAKIRIEKINQTWSGVNLQSEMNYRIDGGSDVAPVTTTGTNEILSNTHAFSGLTVTNMTTIVVYVDTDTGWTLSVADISTGGKKMVFMTEEFNDTQSISAVTWTVYYCMRYNAVFDTEAWFFGALTRNSNITNFQWSSAGAKAWNTAATWMFNLLTRQWTSPSTWQFNLLTRQWTSPSTWMFNLLTRQWTSPSTWMFNLITRQWNSPATWMFDLATRQWNTPATWMFDLGTKIWNDVATWNFDLLTRQWSSVTTWMFDLTTKAWNDVASWGIDLITRQWTNPSTWMFDLATRQWSSPSTWMFDLATRGWFTITIWEIALSTSSLLMWAILALPILVSVGSIGLFLHRRKKKSGELSTGSLGSPHES